MHRGDKYIAAGKQRIKNNCGYALSMAELESLILTAEKESIIDAVANAFYMGVEAGARMTKQQAQ